jgi:hypothetical protein
MHDLSPLLSVIESIGESVLFIEWEPVKLYYDHLVKLFSYKPTVIVFPFGAGSTNIQLNVSISGKDGDGMTFHLSSLSYKALESLFYL